MNEKPFQATFKLQYGQGLTDLPSFLNKIDFYGKLLPGYVLLVIYSLLFRAALPTPVNVAVGDLGFSVYFLIAGAAIGYTLFQSERLIRHTLRSLLATIRGKRQELETYLKKFVSARLKSNAEQKLELDDVISQYDFAASLSLGLYGLFLRSIVLKMELSILALLFLSGTFFSVAAWQTSRGIRRYVDGLGQL